MTYEDYLKYKKGTKVLDNNDNTNSADNLSAWVNNYYGYTQKKHLTPKDNANNALSMSNNQDDAVIGDNLNTQASYADSNILQSPDKNTNIIMNQDGTFSTKSKHIGKVVDDNNNVHEDRTNGLYQNAYDKENANTDIFMKAIKDGTEIKYQRLYSDIESELQLNTKLLTDPNVNEEQKQIAQVNIDTLKMTLENPDVLNLKNFKQQYLYDPSKSSVVNTDLQPYINRLSEPEQQQYKQDIALLKPENATNINIKDPVTYMFSYTATDGSTKYKIGYADGGGIDKRYLNEHHKDVNILGIYQGKDAAELEKRLHHTLQYSMGMTKSNKVGNDNTFGSGTSEVYDIDPRTTTDTRQSDEYNNATEAIVAQTQANQAIEYAKAHIGIEKVNGITSYGKNIGKELVGSVANLGAGLLQFVAEGAVSMQDGGVAKAIQDPHSILGNVINKLNQFQNDSNYMLGIDTTIQDESVRSFSTGLEDMKEGHILKGIGSMLSSLKAAPEVLAQSLPYMFGLEVAGLPLKMVSGLSAESKLTALSRNTITMTAATAPTNVVEAIKNNNGKELTKDKIAQIYAMSTIDSAIQVGGFELALHGGKLFAKSPKGELQSFEDLLNSSKVTKDGIIFNYKNTASSALRVWSTKVIGAGLAEAPAEFIDPLLTALAQKSNTEQYKNQSDKDILKQELPNAIYSAWMGFASGGLMKGSIDIKELQVPFSDIAFQQLHKEAYIKQSISSYVDSLNEEDRKVFNTNIQQSEDSFKNVHNKLIEIYNNDIDTSIKDMRAYISNLGSVSGNMIIKNTEKDPMLNNVYNKVIANVIHNVSSTPEVINTLIQTGTISNLIDTLKTNSELHKNDLDYISSELSTQGIIDNEVLNLTSQENDKNLNALDKFSLYLNTKLQDINNLDDGAKLVLQDKISKFLDIVNNTAENHTLDKSITERFKQIRANMFFDISDNLLNKGNDTIIKQSFNNTLQTVVKASLSDISSSIELLGKTKDIASKIKPKIQTEETKDITLNKMRNDLKNKLNTSIDNDIKSNGFIKSQLEGIADHLDIGKYVDKEVRGNIVNDIVSGKSIEDIVSELHLDKEYNTIDNNELIKEIQNNLNSIKVLLEDKASNNKKEIKDLQDKNKKLSQLLFTKKYYSNYKDDIKAISNKQSENANDVNSKLKNGVNNINTDIEKYTGANKLEKLGNMLKAIILSGSGNKIKEKLNRLSNLDLNNLLETLENTDSLNQREMFIKNTIATILKNRTEGKIITNELFNNIDELNKDSNGFTYNKFGNTYESFLKDIVNINPDNLDKFLEDVNNTEKLTNEEKSLLVKKANNHIKSFMVKESGLKESKYKKNIEVIDNIVNVIKSTIEESIKDLNIDTDIRHKVFEDTIDETISELINDKNNKLNSNDKQFIKDNLQLIEEISYNTFMSTDSNVLDVKSKITKLQSISNRTKEENIELSNLENMLKFIDNICKG